MGKTKLCHKCGIVKPISEFGLDAQKRDGFCWRCRDCVKKANANRMAISKQGRKVALARCTTEELLNELRYRLWQEEEITR
jgi:hypothetical protein